LRKGREVVVLAAALLAISCGGASSPVTPPPPTAPPTPPPPPRVAILSIDGLRPDALDEGVSPNILALGRRGTVSMSAQTVFQPVTLISHASMLSGYLPQRHGLSWDDYRPERGLIRVPTIFSVAKAAARRTVFITGKEKLQHLLLPNTVDTFVLATRGDEDVANAAIVQAGTDFDLMFVHFPTVDITGHASNWMSEKFLRQVTSTDAAIGRVLAALPAGTTTIVTSDHGGVGNNHGQNQPSDMTIPWIIAGPDIVKGQVLPVTLKVSTMDTAATALKVLGLSLPPDASGRPVDEAFDPRSSYRR
jgi:predicted AlkP superfamily pyrophosphatase or phosphodiesterase